VYWVKRAGLLNSTKQSSNFLSLPETFQPPLIEKNGKKVGVVVQVRPE